MNPKFSRGVYLIAISGMIFLAASALNPAYEYFIDEFYYLACADNPSFGYIDHPPLSVWFLGLIKIIFGNSILAMRITAALSYAAIVFVSALISSELGGKRFAQNLTALAVAYFPLILVLAGFYTMNIFEILIFSLIILYIIKAGKTGNPKHWLIAGVFLGLAFLNKHTIVLFAMGLLFGLLFSPMRKNLMSRYFWLAVLIAFLIFLPNLIWLTSTGFQSLEFYGNANLYKNIQTPPSEFIKMQAIFANPLFLPVILAGFIYFLQKDNRKYSFIPVTFLFVFVIMLISGSSRPDRLTAAYPGIIAGGALFFEKLAIKKKNALFKILPVPFIIAGALIYLPITTTILPPGTLTGYLAKLGLTEMEIEKGKVQALPQYIADKIGWREVALGLSEKYLNLPDSIRTKTAVFATYYGLAGALELYTEDFAVPKVLCPHNNYYLWGKEYLENNPGKIEYVITVGIRKEEIRKSFNKAEFLGIIENREYAPEYLQERQIFIASQPRKPLPELFKQSRKFL